MRFLRRVSVPPPRGAAVRPGTTVDGRYRLVRDLAEGRAGDVWLARDLELGREVVLKRLAVTGSAGFDRLWAEARALARFSHPHVVTLYHAVRGRAASWLVMEHVPGGSLDGRPGLSPGVAARVGAQIAGALAALHAEGIVHCDVKPGNVVVTGDGTAKLADFGAAYRVGGTETITPNSAVSYTPGYAAPEVVRGQPEPKSDVFSLAATVYALVAGGPPRRGAAARPSAHGGDRDGGRPDPVAAHALRREAARGVVALEADVGPLAGVLSAMLRRDPGERLDAAEARRRLAELADPAGPVPAPLPDEQPPPPARNRPVLVRFLAHKPGSTPAPPRAARAFARKPRTPHDRPGFVRFLVRKPGAAHDRPGLGVEGRRLRVIVVAVVVVMVALAVWGWGGGRVPLPGPAAESAQEAGRPPATGPAGGDVLGDRRTADPCALLSPASLARFGRTELDPAYGNFDRCDVLVRPPSDTVVDVRADLNLDPPPEQVAAARTTGVVTVVEDPGESHACNRTLILGGVADTTITVTAKRDDDGEAALCEIADAATDDAVRTLNRGPLARRSPGFPPTSLARQDACTLLPARALEIVPGIDAADPDRGYGGWDCGWVSTTSDVHLDLRFDQGRPPDATGGTATRLSGLRAYVRPEAEGDETCLAQIVYRTYDDRHGRRAAETVRVLVGGSRPMRELCRMATGLAGAAASRLPPA